MFDDWMPNDHEENKSVVAKEDHNDIGVKLEYDIKIEVLEEVEVEDNKKKFYDTMVVTEKQYSKDVNLTKTTPSKSDFQTRSTIKKSQSRGHIMKKKMEQNKNGRQSPVRKLRKVQPSGSSSKMSPWLVMTNDIS